MRGLEVMGLMSGLVAATLGAALRAASVAGRVGVRERLIGPGAVAAPPWFQAATARVGATDPGSAVVWRWCRIAFLPSVLALLLVAPLAGVLVGVVASAIAVQGASRTARGEAARAEAELPAVIDHLAASLRCGASLAQALEAAAGRPGALAADLASVVGEHRAGASVQEAIDAWAVRRSVPGVRLLADALGLAGRSGGSQVRALGGVRASVREQQALAREVRALAAQARVSAGLLVVLPIGFAGAMAALDPRVGAFLTGTAGGWGCIAGGVALDGAGAWWMHRLVAGVGR